MINQILNIPNWQKLETFTNSNTPPGGFSRIYPGPDQYWYAQDDTGITKRFALDYQFGNGFDTGVAATDSFVNYRVDVNAGSGLTFSFDGVGSELIVSGITSGNLYFLNTFTQGYAVSYNTTSNAFVWSAMPSANISGSSGSIVKFNSATGIGDSLLREVDGVIYLGATPSTVQSYIGLGISQSVNIGGKIYLNNDLNRYIDGTSSVEIRTTSDFLVSGYPVLLGSTSVAKIIDAKTDLTTYSTPLGYDRHIEFLSGLVSANQRSGYPALFVNATPVGLTGVTPSGLIRTPTFSFSSASPFLNRVVGTFGVALGLSGGGIQINDGTEGQYKILVSSTTQGHGIWATMVEIGTQQRIPIYQRTGDFDVADTMSFTESFRLPFPSGPTFTRSFLTTLSIDNQSLGATPLLVQTGSNIPVNFVVPNVGATGTVQFIMSRGTQYKYGSFGLFDGNQIVGSMSNDEGLFIKDLSNTDIDYETSTNIEKNTRHNATINLLSSEILRGFDGQIYDGGYQVIQAWNNTTLKLPQPLGWTSGWTNSVSYDVSDTFDKLAKPSRKFFPRSVIDDSIYFRLPTTTITSQKLNRTVYANAGKDYENNITSTKYSEGIDTQIIRKKTTVYINQNWQPIGGHTAGHPSSFTNAIVPNIIYQYDFSRMGATTSNLNMDTIVGKWLRVESGEWTGRLTQSTGLFVNPQFGSYFSSGVGMTLSRLVGIQVAQEVGILTYNPNGFVQEAYDYVSARISNGASASGIGNHVGFYAQSKLMGTHWDPTGRRTYDYGQSVGTLDAADQSLYSLTSGRLTPRGWPTYSIYPNKPWAFFAEKDKSNFGGGVLIDIGATLSTTLNAYLEIQGVTGIYNTYSFPRTIIDLDGSFVTVSALSYSTLLPQILLRPGLTLSNAPDGSLFYSPGYLGFFDGGLRYNLLATQSIPPAGLTGVGVMGYVPVWTFGDTLRGTSSIFVTEAGAGNVGIRTIVPTYPLQIATSSTASLLNSGLSQSFDLWNVAVGISGSIQYQDGSHGVTGSVLMADASGKTNLYPLVLPGPGITASFARVSTDLGSGYVPLYVGSKKGSGASGSSEYQLGPIMRDSFGTDISLLVRPQSQFASNNPAPTATFTASISGITMSVTSILSGSGNIAPISNLSGVGLATGTQIIENISGTGSTGTYKVNISQTLGNTLLTSTRQIRNLTLVVPSMTTAPVGFTQSVEFLMSEGNQNVRGHKIFSQDGKSRTSVNIINMGDTNVIGLHYLLTGSQELKIMGANRPFASAAPSTVNYTKSILTSINQYTPTTLVDGFSTGTISTFPYSRASISDTFSPGIGGHFHSPSTTGQLKNYDAALNQSIGRYIDTTLANNYSTSFGNSRVDEKHFIGEFHFSKISSTQSNLNKPTTFLSNYNRSEFGHNFVTTSTIYSVLSRGIKPAGFATSSVSLMTGMFVNNQLGGYTWSYATATYSIGVYSRQDVDNGRISKAYDFYASRMGASASLSRIDNHVGFYAQSKVFGTSSLDPTGRLFYGFDSAFPWAPTFSYGWTGGNNSPWSFFAESDKAGFGGGILLMGTNSSVTRSVNSIPSYEDILGVYRNGKLPSWLTIQESLTDRAQISLLASETKATAQIRVDSIVPTSTSLSLLLNHPTVGIIIVPTFSFSAAVSTSAQASELANLIVSNSSYGATSAGNFVSVTARPWQGSSINSKVFSVTNGSGNFTMFPFAQGLDGPVPLTTSDGDMWHTGTALYFKSGGATYNLLLESKGATGSVGPAGAVGSAGTDGRRAGIAYQFQTQTTDPLGFTYASPPGSQGLDTGKITFNSTGSVGLTKMWISGTDIGAVAQTQFITSWNTGDILTWNRTLGAFNSALTLRVGTVSGIFGSPSKAFYEVSVELLSGSPQSPAIGFTPTATLITLNYQPIGPTGFQGTTGAQGSTGVASIGIFTQSNFFTNGVSLSNGVLTLGAASTFSVGLVHTGSQTFSGDKFFFDDVFIGPTSSNGLYFYTSQGTTYSGLIGPTGATTNLIYRLPSAAQQDRYLKIDSQDGSGNYNLVWGTVSAIASSTIDTLADQILVGDSDGFGFTSSTSFKMFVGSMNMQASCNSTISAAAANECQNTILGGQDHCISDSINSGIFGGDNGTVSCAQNSIIIGGKNNDIRAVSGGSQPGAAIIGGENNTIYGACFAGGSFNHSIIAGGMNNTLNCRTEMSAIIGGCNNTICATSFRSAIIAGHGILIATNSDNSSAIAGVNNVMVNSNCSGMFGGGNTCIYDSCASGNFLGTNNKIVTSNCSAIIGGNNNCVWDSTTSVIIGGQNLNLGTQSEMVYVPQLMINSVGSLESENRLLVWGSDCKLYYRSALGLPYGDGDGSGGGGGTISGFAVCTSGFDNGATISYIGGFGFMTFSSATKTLSGMVNTTTQTIGGTKSFVNNLFVGDTSVASRSGLYLYSSISSQGNTYSAFQSPLGMTRSLVYDLPSTTPQVGQSLMVTSIVGSTATIATISTTWSFPLVGTGLTQTGGTISLLSLSPNNVVRVPGTFSYFTFTASLSDNNKLFDVTTGDNLYRIVPPLDFISKIPGSATSTVRVDYSGFEFRVRKLDLSDGVVSIQIGTNSDLYPYVNLTRQNQMAGIKYDSASQSWTGYIIDQGLISPNTVLGNFGTTHSYMDEYQVVDLNDTVQKAPNYTEGVFPNDWLSGVIYQSTSVHRTTGFGGLGNGLFNQINQYIGGLVKQNTISGFVPVSGISLPAFSLTKGKRLKLSIDGTFSRPGTGTVSFDVSLDQKQISFVNYVNPLGSTASFTMEYNILVTNGGLSGSIASYGKISIEEEYSRNASYFHFHQYSGSQSTLYNLSVPTPLSTNIIFSGAAAGSITILSMTIERFG